MFIAKKNHFLFELGDSSFLSELLHNIAVDGNRNSSVWDSVKQYAFNDMGYLTQDPYTLCKANLDQVLFNHDYFKVHAYFYLYLLAPFVFIFPSENILIFLQAFSFWGLLVGVFYVSRKENAGYLVSIVMCIITIFHPAYSIGFMGQIYTDKFFLIFGIIFAYIIYKQRVNSFILFLMCAFICLLHERMGTILAMYAFPFMILNHGKKIKFLYVFILLLGLCYSFYTMAYFVEVDTGKSGFIPSSFEKLNDRFQNANFREESFVFLRTNSLFLFLAIFNFPSFVATVLTMLPNLIGSIGGAEKTGWATHYHMYYLPFLVFSAFLGLSRILKFIKLKFDNQYLKILILTILTLIAYPVQFSNFNQKEVQFNFNNVRDLLPFKLYEWSFFKNDWYFQRYSDLLVLQSIPKGSIVSTPEDFFPPFIKNYKIRYYPLGLGEADYLILTKDISKNGKSYYVGARSFRDPEEIINLNLCLNEKIERSGYKIANDFNMLTGIVVLKKN
ncbi:MAG: DUF2079 domain-containing protein [Leptospira sp.]|nr:DUF2079 domain-containing protein [Leptospira sp.]